MKDEPPARPWYHRPEWIIAVVSALTIVLGGVGALSQGAAQTAQNSRDIVQLQRDTADVPERLARIEQKVDDLKTIEVRAHGRGEQ